MLSPCIHVCKIGGSFCMGCGRTVNEVGQWTKMDDTQKIHLMETVLPLRKTFLKLDFDSLGILGQRLQNDNQKDILEHLMNLDSEGRRTRFGYALSDEALQKWFYQLDWQSTIVWGVYQQNSLHHQNKLVALGMLNLHEQSSLPLTLSDDKQDFPTWELGLSVLKEFRKQGLGGQLIQGALSIAQQVSQSGKMILYTQKDCTPIFRLVNRLGGRLENQMGERVGLFEW